MRKLFIFLAIITVSLVALWALRNFQFKPEAEADTAFRKQEQPVRGNEKTVDTVTVLDTANERKAKKIALLIAVQNYPAISCWGTLHSLNDVQLLKKALKKYGFSVKTLTEEAATHKGIIKAINDLKSECAPGDMVWVHFSGHGQQMPDVMGDEDENLTEAFIPFDALKDSTHDYHGENHLTDDEINEYLIPIRNRLTAAGQILVTIDACHSEGATRGGNKNLNGSDNLIIRGTTKPFDVGKRIKRKNKLKNPANGIEISACRSVESNYEYKNKYGTEYGSLSYLLYLGINKQGENLDFKKLAKFVTTESNYKPIMPNQTPNRKIMNNSSSLR